MANPIELKANLRIRADGNNVVHIERLEAGTWVSGTRFFSASSSSSSSSSRSSSSSSSSSSTSSS